MSLNKILLIGNMLTDPEIRYTAAGKQVACFRVETTRRFLVEGEVRRESETFSIAAFGRLAEVAAEFLSKSKAVFVEGRVRTRKWQDAQGSWHHRTEVIAESIRLIGNGEGLPPHDTLKRDGCGVLVEPI